MTPTTSPQQAPEHVTDLVNERISLENEIAPLQARLAEVNKRLRNEVEPGKYTAGAFDLTVSASRRFDKKRFEETFPPEKHPEFYETTETTTLVKDRISKAVQETYSTTLDNRITIK